MKTEQLQPPPLSCNTMEILSRRFDLIDKLKKYQEMLDGLESSFLPGRRMDGMPHGNSIVDRTGALASEIADVKSVISDIESEIDDNEREIQAIVKSVDDVIVRTALNLRYMQGMQWKEVAGCMGKYRTETSVKNLVYRYMRKHFN